MNKELLERFNKRDSENNVLTCCNKTGKLSLFLSSENRKRDIGVIKFINGIMIYEKKEKEAQIFRKNNSWSIPYIIVELLLENSKIIFHTEKCTYSITKEDVLKNGSFLFFKRSGFEKKIYIPIKFWNIN